MADTTDIQTTEDVGPSEEVETSQTVDTTSEDVELEDIEVSLDELDSDDEAETETEEPDDEAATESDETEEEVEEEAETDVDQKPEEPKEVSEAERKRLNDEYAKRRIAEKQLAAERQQREAENLQRYLDEAGDDEFERERRELEVNKFQISKERSDLNTQRIEVGLDKAVAEIDLFRNGTDEQIQELDNAYQDYLKLHVRYDQQGNVLSVDKDITEHLKARAETILKLSGVGARQEAKDRKLTKARTDTLPTRPPKEAKVDSDVADFDKGWDS